MKNNQLIHRVGYAVSGFKHAFQNEKSIRFQVVFAILTIIFLLLFQPGLIWWAIVVTMIALVISAELFNTAIEILCDYIQPEHHDAIGRIKDVSAAAVLCISLGSVGVGVFLLFELMFGS